MDLVVHIWTLRPESQAVEEGPWQRTVAKRSLHVVHALNRLWCPENLGLFKVEKGFALPQDAGGRAPKYPFAQMKVGDSFLAPVPEGEPAILVQKRVLRAANAFKTRHQSRAVFTTRQTDEGIRCWRTK